MNANQVKTLQSLIDSLWADYSQIQILASRETAKAALAVVTDFATLTNGLFGYFCDSQGFPKDVPTCRQPHIVLPNYLQVPLSSDADALEQAIRHELQVN